MIKEVENEEESLSKELNDAEFIEVKGGQKYSTSLSNLLKGLHEINRVIFNYKNYLTKVNKLEKFRAIEQTIKKISRFKPKKLQINEIMRICVLLEEIKKNINEIVVKTITKDLIIKIDKYIDEFDFSDGSSKSKLDNLNLNLMII